MYANDLLLACTYTETTVREGERGRRRGRDQPQRERDHRGGAPPRNLDANIGHGQLRGVRRGGAVHVEVESTDPWLERHLGFEQLNARLKYGFFNNCIITFF